MVSRKQAVLTKPSMRIQLPNPNDGSVEQWFAHMRIVLKAAEKTYQQMVKDHGQQDADGNNPWVSIEAVQTWPSMFEGIDMDSLNEDLQRGLFIEVDHL